MLSSPPRKPNGSNFEDIACTFLKKNGYEIVVRNFRVNGGEIDIVSKKNGIVYLNEVKKRTSFAENCVSLVQMERIWFTYNLFLEKYPEYQSFEVLIQLILVVNNKATILEII
jgi:Holliday junction resolvase-like predicted endonuclease